MNDLYRCTQYMTVMVLTVYDKTRHGSKKKRARKMYITHICCRDRYKHQFKQNVTTPTYTTMISSSML